MVVGGEAGFKLPKRRYVVGISMALCRFWHWLSKQIDDDETCMVVLPSVTDGCSDCCSVGVWLVHTDLFYDDGFDVNEIERPPFTNKTYTKVLTQVTTEQRIIMVWLVNDTSNFRFCHIVLGLCATSFVDSVNNSHTE